MFIVSLTGLGFQQLSEVLYTLVQISTSDKLLALADPSRPWIQ